MQGAGADHAVKLTAQADHLVVDGAAVSLDLRLAGAADEAEAAALPFEVGPRAHQPRPLIAERGQFDLQHAFAGAGAVGEDFEDEPGPVQDLDVPFLFQIALLHRADRAVDQHQLGLGLLQGGAQFIELARREQHPR